jgi:hypothetical protein
VTEAIRLSKINQQIQKTSSIALNLVNQHSLGDPHIDPDLVVGTPQASLPSQAPRTFNARRHTIKNVVPTSLKLEVSSEPRAVELTNKNILSKKALDQLNQT